VHILHQNPNLTLPGSYHCLPFIEFSSNLTIHSSTEFLSFEIVYVFNPLTPIDLIPFCL
jgi:hypothetical protein